MCKDALINDESVAKHGRWRFFSIFSLIVDKDERLVFLVVSNVPEKAHQLWNAQSVKHSFVIDSLANSFGFFLLHLLQPLIHSVLDHETLDKSLGFLTNTKDAAERFPFISLTIISHVRRVVERTLLFDATVPPKVDANHFRSHRQVETNTARTERSNHDLMLCFTTEICN